MGRILAVLVLVSLFGGLAVVAGANGLPPGGTFTDDDGNIHEGNIEGIAAAGITKGCNPPVNDRYCPSDPVTRGQMAAFLRRTFGLSATGEDFFVDDAGSVFEADINALAAAGITKGCNPPDNDRYCPDGHVTRGQMAAFLRRAFGYPTVTVDFFIDDSTSVFEADINAIAAEGVTKGCNPPDNDRYCPDAKVLRDQMASFLARALALSPPEQRWYSPIRLQSPLADGDGFGRWVAASGDLVVTSDQLGRALVFVRDEATNTWNPSILTAASAGSVATDGTRVAVAASTVNAVYVFTPIGGGWSSGQTVEILTVTSIDEDIGEATIAMDKDRVVLRPAYDDRVVVFTQVADSWNEELLEPSNPGAFDWGGDVDVEDGTVAAGNPNQVHLFTWNGSNWLEETITNPGGPADFFGTSVSLNDGELVVGASGSSPGPGAPGSVWLFQRDSSGWTPTLVAKSGESFGTKVAADGERILILAPGPAFEQHAWMAGPDLAGWRIWPVLADIPTYEESASDADLDAGTAAIGVTRGWDTPGYVLVFRW